MTAVKRTPTRVLYLDIDGTVRHGRDELGRFVNGPDDVRVFDGVPERLAAYKTAGWRIVGVSNQGGIALGHVHHKTVALAMAETTRQCGGPDVIDAMLWCRHHPDAATPDLAVCWCRKPRAGLLIEATMDLEVKHADERYPQHLALMVGDRLEDAQAAAAAAVPFMGAAAWRAGEHDDQIGGAA